MVIDDLLHGSSWLVDSWSHLLIIHPASQAIARYARSWQSLFSYDDFMYFRICYSRWVADTLFLSAKKSMFNLAWSRTHFIRATFCKVRAVCRSPFYAPLQPDRFLTCPTNGKSLKADEITFQGFVGCGFHSAYIVPANAGFYLPERLSISSRNLSLMTGSLQVGSYKVAQPFYAAKGSVRIYVFSEILFFNIPWMTKKSNVFLERFSTVAEMDDPSAKNIVDLYDRHAADFDQDRNKTLFEKPWLDRFRAVLPDDATVLDLGCGSGEPIAAYLIGCGYRLTGVDSSPSMIGMCLSRFPDHQWTVADMRTLHLGQTFDGILGWDSLFHLTQDDQQAMFPIFKAHAKPGSALMFTSGPRAGEAIGLYQGESLYHASLDPDEYESLLAANGFTVVEHIAEDADCGGHTVWLAQRYS